MGRWLWVTIRGRQSRQVTIITTYKVCNQPIKQAGPLTAISQQWQIAQSENRGNDSMSHNTINDLRFFINSQRNLGTEIILGMNANETANCKNSNIIKLCRTCKLCDPISMKHGTAREPNTFSRGSGRIYFILCSRALLQFISSVGILPFGTIAFSNLRGMVIDINLYQLLRNPNTDLVTNYPWTLISSHPIRVLQYKKELETYLTKRNIQTKIRESNKLMENKQLTEAHMTEIRDINKTVTIGMLSS